MPFRWNYLAVVCFTAVALVCCLGPVHGDALAADVRNAQEYALALREGQRPPLVAPTLEDGRRVPVFQYYSGTAYLVPGLLARRGVRPDAALKASIVLHLVAAGWFAFLAARMLRRGAAASIAAGMVCQVAPFAASLRPGGGAYPAFAAWACLPLVFYCGLRLVHATRRVDRRRWLCVTALALAYFIPLRPTHAVVGGAIVIVLLMVDALVGTGMRRAALAWLPAAVACAAAASAWFWWPLMRDRAEVPALLGARKPGYVLPPATAQSRLRFILPDRTLDPSAATLARLRDRRRVRFVAEVAPGREGQYQLPVYSLPSGEVLVNGHRLNTPPPALHGMAVVPLRAGTNFITIRARPAAAAWRLSVFACAALAAGALLATYAGRPRPSVSVRHLS